MTDKLTAADVLRIVADAVWKPREGTVYGEEATLAGIAHRLRDEAARREAVEETPADVPDNWVRRRVYKNSQEHSDYLNARFKDKTIGTFEYDGHRWRYEYTSFDDKGDYDVIVRPQSQPDAPPPPADDLVKRIEKVLNGPERHVYGIELLAMLRDVRAAIEALRAERDAHKQRGDNHWETLRSIREIARTSGDLERIIQWVSDAGQGYTESAETTLSKEMDARKTAEARVKALEGALKLISIQDQGCGGTLSFCEMWEAAKRIATKALAAGGGNG